MKINGKEYHYVRTLEYFEGDILTEYEADGKIYLSKWCDRTSEGEVWIVKEVTPEAVDDYLDKKISMRDLFECDSKAEAWVVTTKKEDVVKEEKVTMDAVLESYKPTSQAFYDESLA